jgi:ribonuclease HI
MSIDGLVTIFTDGASRGNPGPSAFAYILQLPDGQVIEEKGRLEDTTNNVAEYTALLRALAHARQLGAHRLDLRADSELMVRQLLGQYKVKNEGLRPLYEEVRDLWDQFETVSIRHVPREENRQADRLCNEILDAGVKKPTKPSGPPKNAPRRKGQRHDVREDALECLRAFATAWARGNPNNPRPEDVWDQLWNILEAGGVLK